jgi:hypothetical protein
MPGTLVSPRELRMFAQELIALSDNLRKQADALLLSAEVLERTPVLVPDTLESNGRSQLRFP